MATDVSGSGDKGYLEAMMKELGLTEEDLDDVVVQHDVVPPEATRWMAIARVHNERSYSQFWFNKNMRVAWDLAHKVNIRPLEDNIYTLQFLCFGDSERMMEEGSWALRGDVMVIVRYDGFMKPSSIKLDMLEISTQIHDFHDGYVSQIPSLVVKIGELVYAERASREFEGNFFRVRDRSRRRHGSDLAGLVAAAGVAASPRQLRQEDAVAKEAAIPQPHDGVLDFLDALVVRVFPDRPPPLHRLCFPLLPLRSSPSVSKVSCGALPCFPLGVACVAAAAAASPVQS
ncbi:hypothetical protein D1007_55121 [Hordeum vulgare]|nr:hypothetical protein D1007_55121 [Hordeum vulgare]